MRRLALGLLLAASTCYAQQAAPNLPQAQTQSPAQAATAVPSGTIIVPAGTQIPLTLASPITGRARKGDTVRAAVAFPVTVGNELAIPVGAYVQGTIAQITKRSRSGPSVKMQFSTLVFANGYTVALSGNNLQAKLSDSTSAPTSAGAVSADADGYALAGHGAHAAQTTPTLMPSPNPGPNKGVFIGIGVGLAAAAVLGAVLASRAGGGSNGSILFDTGWQFNMVLNNPLTLNAASATAVP